ncbi:MAG: hypothetical protein KDK70_18230 [Myxococcales bacterium]|nr:hypothetical protein [Myxococcales bacterium]
MAIQNERLARYPFLREMFEDSYFPDAQVEQGKAILVALCEQIEATRPATLEQLYALTHAATERFNDLQEDFERAGSEIETAARDCIATDFAEIAEAYGFDADMEELVATRDW